MKQPGKPERREQGLRSILVVLGIIFLLSYMIRDSLRVSVMVQVIDKDSQLHSPTMITLSSSSSSTPERTPPTRGIEEPISCYSFLQEARSKNSTIVDANGGLMHVNFTLENPGFWISLHNEATDKVRWKPIVELGRYYERDLVRIWDKVLQKAPQGSRVLDVGYVRAVHLASDTQTSSHQPYSFSNTEATLATIHSFPHPEDPLRLTLLSLPVAT